MKKYFCVFTALFIFFSNYLVAEDLFTFSAGLSTGFPAYEKKELAGKIDSINNKHRIIIGSLFTVNLNPYKQITFFTGSDILGDFNWNSDSEYAHCLHVAFPLGVKIYPNLKGFNFGIAYTLGFRADLSNTQLSGKETNIASWSNGFKILAEYNFAHEGKSKYYPSVGLSWNWMPRGNYTHDNIITFYIAENF